MAVRDDESTSDAQNELLEAAEGAYRVEVADRVVWNPFKGATVETCLAQTGEPELPRWMRAGDVDEDDATESTSEVGGLCCGTGECLAVGSAGGLFDDGGGAGGARFAAAEPSQAADVVAARSAAASFTSPASTTAASACADSAAATLFGAVPWPEADMRDERMLSLLSNSSLKPRPVAGGLESSADGSVAGLTSASAGGSSGGSSDVSANSSLVRKLRLRVSCCAELLSRALGSSVMASGCRGLSLPLRLPC